jgi:ATP-dependent helicase/nuclease subunit B
MKNYKILEKKLYTIDINQNYMTTLAKGIVDQFGATQLPYLTILLPSQRGVLEFQTIFSKIFKNSIIPKSTNFTDYCSLLLSENTPDLGFNTFSNFDRHFFVVEYLKKALPRQRLNHLNELALSITSLWDEITLSGKSKIDIIECLEKNVSLSHFPTVFLDITKIFHGFLESQKLLDEKEKLYKILSEATTVLHNNPSFLRHPIILAGTTGTIPVVRELADVLLSYENGWVILPGLTEISSKLSPHHPFYTQNEWMKQYEGNVIRQFFKNTKASLNIANAFLNHPPSTIIETDHYLFFETSSLYKEAMIISLLVRHHLHVEPDKDITIVCGNQYLIQLIQEQLYQFDFFANSSLATSLLNTPGGSFLQALLNLNLKSSLKNMISLLKHPFFQKENRIEHLATLENFEKIIIQDDKITRRNLFTLFPILQEASENLRQCNNFLSWLDIIEQEIEKLSDNFIFCGEDGQNLRKFFDIIKKMPLKMQHLEEWIEWLVSSLKLYTVQITGKQQHQKVRLIGTLESRHNSSEIVIVSGLNEGTWPPIPETNLWLNPTIEKELNLPESTRRLALNAHDFANCLSAERVYLTRALKIDGKIQEKSRFLSRLELHIKPSKNLLNFKQWIESIIQQKTSGNILLENKEPPQFPSQIPLPSKISISALELLNKDPVCYYVRYILRARERPEWYKGLSAANIGQIAHKILEEINFQTVTQDLILQYIAQPISNLDLSFHEKVFLQDQLFNMINFVVDNTISYNYTRQLRERKLSLVLEGIEIYGIADRIDFLTEAIHLIDYKTGLPPTFKSIDKKQSLQMPLLTAMLLKNYNKPLKSSYWKLSGIQNKSQIINLPLTPEICEDHISYVKHMLKNVPWTSQA